MHWAGHSSIGLFLHPKPRGRIDYRYIIATGSSN